MGRKAAPEYHCRRKNRGAALQPDRDTRPLLQGFVQGRVSTLAHEKAGDELAESFQTFEVGVALEI
ncbi:TPA: hypothetical protein ACHTCR_004869, partial [Pseudomonas putida]